MRLFWLCLAVLAMLAIGCDKKDAASAPTTGEPGVAEPAKAADKVGAKLAGADAVTVADLVKDPAKYEGKIVRVEGTVKDFCKHARAWFAIADAEGKLMLRVTAKPRFETPAECLERRAVAEGKVMLQTLTPEQVEYFQKGHKFLAPEAVKPGEPVRLPVIEAFGAEFY
ncbi:MAG: hypothetical protein GYA21_05050 [Myxococcales bacterium]|nr:hypothetical protein [Myxococcales bacterium]